MLGIRLYLRVVYGFLQKPLGEHCEFEFAAEIFGFLQKQLDWTSGGDFLCLFQ